MMMMMMMMMMVVVVMKVVMMSAHAAQGTDHVFGGGVKCNWGRE